VKYDTDVDKADNYGVLLTGTATAIEQFPEALQPKTKEATRNRICLNARNNLPTRFTLTHELGHVSPGKSACPASSAGCKSRDCGGLARL